MNIDAAMIAKFVNELQEIAFDEFPSVDTLVTRNSDGLDFHDVSVGCIRRALAEAFVLGMKEGIGLSGETTATELRELNDNIARQLGNI
jgi:hypothetical protein